MNTTRRIPRRSVRERTTQTAIVRSLAMWMFDLDPTVGPVHDASEPEFGDIS